MVWSLDSFVDMDKGFRRFRRQNTPFRLICTDEPSPQPGGDSSSQGRVVDEAPSCSSKCVEPPSTDRRLSPKAFSDPKRGSTPGPLNRTSLFLLHSSHRRWSKQDGIHRRSDSQHLSNFPLWTLASKAPEALSYSEQRLGKLVQTSISYKILPRLRRTADGLDYARNRPIGWVASHMDPERACKRPPAALRHSPSSSLVSAGRSGVDLNGGSIGSIWVANTFFTC